jgi:hypothetical protein
MSPVSQVFLSQKALTVLQTPESKPGSPETLCTAWGRYIALHPLWTSADVLYHVSPEFHLKERIFFSAGQFPLAWSLSHRCLTWVRFLEFLSSKTVTKHVLYTEVSESLKGCFFHASWKTGYTFADEPHTLRCAWSVLPSGYADNLEVHLIRLQPTRPITTQRT